MLKSANELRIEAAELNRAVKRARETNALSFTFLHVLSLREAVAEHVVMLDGNSQTFYRSYMDAILDLRPSKASRAVALEIAYFAALNVVAEGWQESRQPAPALQDRSVDELLSAEHTKTLRDYRNARWHPNPVMEPRVTRFFEAHKDLLPWSMQLCAALRDYFLRWRATLPLEIADRM